MQPQKKKFQLFQILKLSEASVFCNFGEPLKIYVIYKIPLCFSKTQEIIWKVPKLDHGNLKLHIAT